MDIPTYILNHQAVVNFYGRWPSFHDANVLSYEAPKPETPSLSFTLHTWQMTDEVDAKGYYVLRNHALVTFRFEGVHEAEMERFEAENILSGIRFSPGDGQSACCVVLDSVMDMSGSFAARRGEVVSILPCTSDGKMV